MIVPDVNLLVFAYNAAAPRHAQARDWWQERLSGRDVVGLPWAVILGYVRLVTHRRVLASPIPATQALVHVRAWMARPHVEVVNPGARHLDIIESLVRATGSAGDLTTDIHLAALAIEHQAEVHSNDSDFSRFPGLRWSNPLE